MITCPLLTLINPMIAFSKVFPTDPLPIIQVGTPGLILNEMFDKIFNLSKFIEIFFKTISFFSYKKCNFISKWI